MTTPTNADIEKLLAQEPYLGAEHLQSEYESLWSYMRQDNFKNSIGLLRKIKINGKNYISEHLEKAREVVNHAVTRLEELSQREYELTFNLSEEQAVNVRSWCNTLSKLYSPLMLCLEDTA